MTVPGKRPRGPAAGGVDLNRLRLALRLLADVEGMPEAGRRLLNQAARVAGMPDDWATRPVASFKPRF